MENEYYVWNTEVEAQMALDFINTTTWFPIISNNAGTGLPAPDKQQTISWSDNVLERIDGKWCFPRIPEGRLDTLNVPASSRQAYLNAFSPSIEVYQETWFPVVSGEF